MSRLCMVLQCNYHRDFGVDCGSIVSRVASEVEQLATRLGLAGDVHGALCISQLCVGLACTGKHDQMEITHHVTSYIGRLDDARSQAGCETAACT